MNVPGLAKNGCNNSLKQSLKTSKAPLKKIFQIDRTIVTQADSEPEGAGKGARGRGQRPRREGGADVIRL